MTKLIYTVKSIYEKNKKQTVLLVGAVLLLLVLCLSDTERGLEKQSAENTKTVYLLENELEKKLETFLETVDGVGTVKVCVTFDILEQTSYAQNTQADVKEKGNKNTSEYVIIENSDGTEGGLAVAIRAPAVRGVAVVCEGGGSAKVRSDVTALISSVLGISSNRVYVSQHKQNKK